MFLHYDPDKIATIRSAFFSNAPFDSSELAFDILASWKRSKLNKLNANTKTFPVVTAADVKRGKAHVSGYTAHIRNSSSFYYQKEIELLDAIRACLCYIAPNFDIYGRYGNQELKNELKELNLCLGANLAEERVGTNAAALCALSHNDTWVIGKEHYSSVLQDFACFAFPVKSGYNKSFYVMLIIRCCDLTPQIPALFEFIKSSESIVSSGMTTSDIILKNEMLEYKMTKNGTILIAINQHGMITYANDVFFRLFRRSISNTINYPLEKVLPNLKFALQNLENGVEISTKEVLFSQLPAGKNRFFMDGTPIQEHNIWIGMVITLTKEQNITDLVHKVANLNAKFTFDDLIGQSANFVRIKEMAKRVALSPSTIMILGESGTGKELFAHSIHSESPRRNHPFISINCAAIPRELIGSELFGYVAGAFTGAIKTGAQGKFELANGGTLFLDEIAEMPLDMQSVLLRVLEDKTITRIGDSKQVPVDVRLIVATNKDLRACVEEGNFRLDLYYRLNVIQIPLIPLREHPEDIPLLVSHFLRQFSKNLNKEVFSISPDALEALCAYSWPGNIRELRNIMERGVNMALTNELTISDLPPELMQKKAVFLQKEEVKVPATYARLSSDFDSQRTLLIRQLMDKYHGNKSLVAKELGIARTTLYRILKNLHD